MPATLPRGGGEQLRPRRHQLSWHGRRVKTTTRAKRSIVVRCCPSSRIVVAAFGTIPSIDVLDDDDDSDDDDVDCRGTVVAPPVDARDSALESPPSSWGGQGRRVRRPLPTKESEGTIPSLDVLDDDDDDDVDCRGTVVAPPVDARDDVRPRIASILPEGMGATSAA